ncbi:MAG: helix-turn-helix domain-containing protein [Clostridiales bacterium]|nr:helix-turn-helix domain-containing protein [Clostridiales bacterium]
MKQDGAYAQVMVQMYLQGMDSHTLSEKTGISYPSLRRKLRGDGHLRLDEAIRIRKALACPMSIEELFARKAGA